MNLYSLLCVRENFIPESVIKFILENKYSNYSEAELVDDDNNTQIVTDYRKTKWVNYPNEIRLNLMKTIRSTHQQILSPIYNSTFVEIEPPQILRYDVGDYYHAHNDSESFKNGKLERIVNRDISILLYLNDEYEGGELEFTKLQLTIRPKARMLIAFPSYYEFEHKVHPVTKGTRYSIVSWIHTEKRIYDRPYETNASNNVRRKWILPD